MNLILYRYGHPLKNHISVPLKENPLLSNFLSKHISLNHALAQNSEHMERLRASLNVAMPHCDTV